MRKFTKEELEFVKDCLKNKIPKNRFIRSVLHTDCRVFDRMCLEEGFEYQNLEKIKFGTIHLKIWKIKTFNID